MWVTKKRINEEVEKSDLETEEGGKVHGDSENGDKISGEEETNVEKN